MRECAHKTGILEPVMETFDYGNDEITIEIKERCDDCNEILSREIQTFKLDHYKRLEV